jgi:tripartite-type tricarboxylate transporter receptor subunit TctC
VSDGTCRSAKRVDPKQGAELKLQRRRFLHLAAGAAVLPAVSRIASAQTYPSRPVRFIVAYAAGGASDVLARLIGQHLSERLGQPVQIENRVGGGGNIGAEAVARAPSDGYTFLLVNSTHTMATSRHSLAPYASGTGNFSIRSANA